MRGLSSLAHVLLKSKPQAVTMNSMSKIVLAVVLVFGFGGYFAGRVIGAEPALPSIDGPVSVGASGTPSAGTPSSEQTPEDDDDVDEVRPSPTDIDGDDGEDNSGPGSANSGPDDDRDDRGDNNRSGSADFGRDDDDDDDEDNSGPGSANSGRDDDDD